MGKGCRNRRETSNRMEKGWHNNANVAVKVKKNALAHTETFRPSMGAILVGQTVEIEWVENEKSDWYLGIVTSYHEKDDKHRVEYFNNEIEFVTLMSDRSNHVNWRIPPAPKGAVSASLPLNRGITKRSF